METLSIHRIQAPDLMQSLRVTSCLVIAASSALLIVSPSAHSQTTLSQPSSIERNEDRDLSLIHI